MIRPAFFPVCQNASSHGSTECAQGHWLPPLASRGAALGLLVPYLVSVPEDKVLGQVGLPQQSWTCIPVSSQLCPCAVTNSCGQWLVFGWGVGRRPLLNHLLEHYHMMCVNTILSLGLSWGWVLGKRSLHLQRHPKPCVPHLRYYSLEILVVMPDLCPLPLYFLFWKSAWSVDPHLNQFPQSRCI